MPNKPPFNITEEMLGYVAEIAEALGGIKSVETLDKLPRLRRIGRIKSVHSSLAIENNSLTLDQVSDILEGKRVIGPPDEILEVKNAFAAYKELENVDPYDIKDLLRVHGIMTAGLVEESGKFRTVNEGVYASDGRVVHVAPQPIMIGGLMRDLFDWMKTSKAHALIKSSVFHYEFEFIHPFRDGNGRIGRLWHTAILMTWKPVFAWIPIESIIRERQAEYYNAITQSTSEGTSDTFILFMLKATLDAVKEIVTDAQAHINHINTRIRDLMAVLEYYPMGTLELMERLKLRSRKSFYANYLKPAIEAGLVFMTVPDKPTSRNQLYYKK